MNTIKYKGFEASLDFDPEDKIIVGRVLDISDIISFHALSIPEFEEVFQQSIDSYIRDCETLNRAPEKPASGKLMLRVNPSIHAAALKEAKRNGVSLNKWAESVLKIAAHASTN